MASDQTLLLVPGAGHHHEDAWWEALRHGVNREKRKAASKLDGVARRMFDYEGWERPQDLDAATEIADQRESLARLQQLSERKHFRRRGYDALPGKSALREFAYDLAAPMAGAVGLGGWVAGRMVPELVRYWDQDAATLAMKQRFREWLAAALSDRSDVVLICHGFGAVLAWDALWSLSHEPNSRVDQAVSLWLTIGSPLADNTVRRRLNGRGEQGAVQHPTNIRRWLNVAAEDDHVCHDETVSDDFSEMLRVGGCDQIDDQMIYNHAVRHGRSDPHDALGYLIHPTVSDSLIGWVR